MEASAGLLESRREQEDEQQVMYMLNNSGCGAHWGLSGAVPKAKEENGIEGEEDLVPDMAP